MPIFTPKETADNMELIKGKISGLNYGRNGHSRGIPGTPEQVQEALLSLIEPQGRHRVHNEAKEYIRELKKLMADKNEAAIYGITTPEKLSAFKTMVIFCISEKIYELGQTSAQEKLTLQNIKQERESRSRETSSQINSRRQNGAPPNQMAYSRSSRINKDMRDLGICTAAGVAPFVGMLMTSQLCLFMQLTRLDEKVSEENFKTILMSPTVIGALVCVSLVLLGFGLNIRDFISDLRDYIHELNENADNEIRLTATQPSLFHRQTRSPSRNAENNNVRRQHNRGR